MNMKKKVFIKQDGTIPGRRIIEELERRGGKNKYDNIILFNFGVYYISFDNTIITSWNTSAASNILSEQGYSEIFYNKETDSFYERPDCSDCVNDKGCINCEDGDMNETKSQRMVSAEAKEALLQDGYIKTNIQNVDMKTYTIITKGEYAIPEGYEAIIEDGKIIIRKKIWQPEDGEVVYIVRMYADELAFYVEYFQLYDDISQDVFREYVLQGTAFPTKEEAQAFCDRLNAAIKDIVEERKGAEK